MKTAYHILVHLLGVGCIAACIAIVATMGSLDIHWSGWLAVGFFVLLALGIVVGWFPWRGKPLRVLVKGFYVMSAIALIGFGFTMNDPMRPQLWMVLVGLAVAVAARIVLKIVFHLRDDEEGDAPHVTEQKPGAASDPFLN